MTELKHQLIITAGVEDGEEWREYDVQHSLDCPSETREISFWLDGESAKYEDYTCLVGSLLAETGLDAITDSEGVEHKDLCPGTYKLVGWTEHYPATPTNGGEEWDAGITAERID